MDETMLWTGPLEHLDRYRVALDAVTSAVAGGEGIVYRAFDTGRRIDVALKLLTVVGLDEFDVLAERLGPLAQITHPNLMANADAFIGTALTRDLHSAPEDFDVIFTVADWVEGRTLPEVVDQADPWQLSSISADIARALHALHEHRSDEARRGVVHRDVKPSNIRVRANGTAVLVDFGIARPLDHGDLTVGVGTYRWRAPEVLTGSTPITTAVDAWGLGAVTFWCFTGQPPGLEGAAAARERLLHADGVRRLPDPDRFATHVASLLVTNPARRPHDLRRWAEQLEELTNPSPAGRRRERVAGIAVPFAVAVAAVSIGTWAESVGGASALDVLTPTDIPVDDRIVIVPFDSVNAGTGFGDIATLAARSGASAVAFLDFDSTAFDDGASGRSFVVGSVAMEQLGVAPLLDTTVADVRGRLPVLQRYRVDPLASELAGIGVVTSNRTGTVREVIALARLTTLSDGERANVDAAGLDKYSADAREVVPGLFLRLAELGEGMPLSSPAPESVRLGDRTVPLQRGDLEVSWSEQLDGRDDGVVVTFADLEATGVAPGSIILVGDTDRVGVPNVDTPLGSIAPVFVQANALNTVLTERYARPATSLLAPMVSVLAAAAVVCAPRRWRWLPALCAGAISIGWLVAVGLAAKDGWRVPPLSVPVSAIAAAALLGLWSLGVRTRAYRRARMILADFDRAPARSRRTTTRTGALPSAAAQHDAETRRP